MATLNLPPPGPVLVKIGDTWKRRHLNGYYRYGDEAVAAFIKHEPGDIDGIVQLDELAWADGTLVVKGVGRG